MEVVRRPYSWNDNIVPKNNWFGAEGAWFYNRTGNGLGGSFISVIGSVATALGGMLPTIIGLTTATGGAIVGLSILLGILSLLFLGFVSVGTSMLYAVYRGYPVRDAVSREYSAAFNSINALDKKDRGFVNDLVKNVYTCLELGEKREADKRISLINSICAELNCMKKKNLVDNGDIETAQHFLEMLQEQRKLSA